MRHLAAIWGVAGILGLLTQAVIRLFDAARQGWNHPFDVRHWILLLTFVPFMAYSEGYRGFQKGFSPRVVARARHLGHGATLVQGLLAPLFCMGYFHATRKRLVTSYLVTAAIVSFIVVVRLAPQPWRGIIDLGVVVGLVWGVVSIVGYVVQALQPGRFDYPADLP
jgi:hypothetical protein